MGRRATVSYRPHRAGIQFRFNWQGRRLSPTLQLAPSAANLKYAARLADEILTKLRAAAFTAEYLADIFPAFERAPAGDDKSFGHYADLWLRSKGDLQPSTKRDYARIVEFWKKKVGEGKAIDAVRASELTSCVGELGVSAKTRNNRLIVLRGICELALADGALKTDPTVTIKNKRAQQDEPDPFSGEERDMILGWFFRPEAADFERAWGDLFQFAFYTGMRSGELYALRWSDIDWKRGEVVVKRAVSAKLEVAQTKTATLRRVKMVPEALEALNRQRPRTQLKGAHVWVNPNTGGQLLHHNKVEKIWGRAMKATAVNYRRPYTTRHTYATMLLMAGCNEVYAAKQMGHSPQMFHKRYAKWIDGEHSDREHAKLLAFGKLAPVSAPQVVSGK